MQLSETQKQEIVTKIRNSTTFKKATTSSALLQYLHNATLSNIQLKEGIIDIEFFGREGSPDKSNPRVRVNVYNLRKKLGNYYENEGKDDNFVLNIDKGQYQVGYAKKKMVKSIFKTITWQQIAPYVALFSALLFILFSNIPPTKPSIWKPFLSKAKSTHLVIGDVFGATGITITGGSGWTRDYDVNSASDFFALIDKKPELMDLIEPANYTYTTGMAAIASQKIQQLFQYHDRSFSIRFFTQTSISEIKEGNAIYAGPIKNNNQFIHFFNEGNPNCKISYNTLSISNYKHMADTSYNLNWIGNMEEYGKLIFVIIFSF